MLSLAFLGLKLHHFNFRLCHMAVFWWCLCISLFYLLQRQQLLDLGSTRIYDLNKSYLQRPYFQMRSHCEVLSRHEFGEDMIHPGTICILFDAVKLFWQYIIGKNDGIVERYITCSTIKNCKTSEMT